MSQAFGHFNGMGNAALAIATGMGTPGGVFTLLPDAVPVIPDISPSAPLAGSINFITRRWGYALEAERRVFIDAFVQSVMELLPASNGAYDPLRIRAEMNVGRNDYHVGHGFLDYQISRVIPGGFGMRPGLIIEAKASLAGHGRGLALDDGQWQLYAELATARQFTSVGANLNRTRGVLTDGRNWRFYELYYGPGPGPGLGPGPGPNVLQFRRTDPYNATTVQGQRAIVYLLRKFIFYYQHPATHF